jgi:hypothetical protein
MKSGDIQRVVSSPLPLAVGPQKPPVSPSRAAAPAASLAGLPVPIKSKIIKRIPWSEKNTFKALCLIDPDFRELAAPFRDTSVLLERIRRLNGKPVNAVDRAFADIVSLAKSRLLLDRHKVLVFAGLARKLIWLLESRVQIWFHELMNKSRILSPEHEAMVLAELLNQFESLAPKDRARAVKPLIELIGTLPEKLKAELHARLTAKIG